MSILLSKYPDIFCNNKYLRHYEALTAKSIITGGYAEKHHIVPKSIVPNNLIVRLTARQHYIAHLLLIRCVQPQYRKKMLYAITAMKMRTAKNIKFNSRIFESIKEEANIARSLSMRGRKHSEEAKRKIKEKRALQVISEETKQKMSNSHKGRKSSPEAIERTRQSHIGRKRSEATRAKLAESRKNYPKLTCEHCGKTMVTVNYNRWHGPRCKSLISGDVA